MRTKTVVLVAGMHRSGTSALTRVVNLLGAAVPYDLMPGAAQNPLGFWESEEVAHIHEELLHKLGSTWDALDPLPANWRVGPHAARAAERAAAFLAPCLEEHDVLVVKDPRLGRLLPLWLTLLDELSVKAIVLLPFRHPMEVALSLDRRDGFPLWKSWTLWMQSCLEAEKSSRAVPRLHIDYSALFTDWRRVAAELHALDHRLGDVTPDIEAAVTAFLNPQLRRNRCNPNALVGMPPPFDRLTPLYEALLSASRGNDDESFQRALDSIATGLEPSVASAGAVTSSGSFGAPTELRPNTGAGSEWRPSAREGAQPVNPGSTVERRLLRKEVLSIPLRLVGPDSWVSHIPFAFWLVSSFRPRVIVELGTHTGNSYSAFAQGVLMAGVAAQCFAVDTWKGDAHAGFYGDEVFAEWARFHADHFPGFSHLLRTTFDDARVRFQDGSIDLLHIDGEHTYERARHDFESWQPKLSNRAVVLFHDIASQRPGFGVTRLWQELRESFPSFEFRHGHGLGVLAVGHELSPDLIWLTQLHDASETLLVRQFFETLGDTLRARLWIDSAQKDLTALAGVQARPGDGSPKEGPPKGGDDATEDWLERNDAAYLAARLVLANQRADYALMVEALHEQIAAMSEEARAAKQAHAELQLVLANQRADYALMVEALHEQIAAMSEEARAAKQAHAELQHGIQTRCEHATRITQDVGTIRRAEDLLAEEISHYQAHIATLAEHLASRDRELAAVRASTSWRLTRPMRAVSHLRKQAIQAFRLAGPAIQLGGGFGPTLRRASRLIRREGINGLRRGFRLVATAGQVSAVPNSTGHDRNDFTEWVRQFDTLTDDERDRIRGRIESWDSFPIISVVMPTYNPKPEWLESAIESVRNQLYPHWQLCIADDASTDPVVRQLLRDYSTSDGRIHVTLREQNGHIAAASNTALESVTGDWVVLLDHDDLLSDDAFFWLVDAIRTRPDAQLIYSDEDKIDELGRRSEPHLKSDWNLDLLYSHNVFCHLGAYRADLIKSVGGFRLGFEGAQDYDLVLRCIERVPPNHIHHIPRILYHWRMHRASTAMAGEAKPYALLAGQKALAEHFERMGVNAAVSLTPAGYRIQYALPEEPPLVSLIMPTRNGLSVLSRCVDSILDKTTYRPFELVIVDNNSDDPAALDYLSNISADPRVRVLRDARAFNYSALNNAAIRQARGSVIGLLNNDLEVITPEWLSEMVAIALQPGVGAVGAKLYYPNDTLQHGGVIVGLGGVAGHSHKGLHRSSFGYCCRAVLVQALSAVTAACLVIRKSVYEEVGGLDEVNLSVAFNDVDFCLRVRDAGYRNVWTPFAEMYHHESATRGYEDTPEKQARFSSEVLYMKARWGESLLADPAYSPNLTLDYEDFSLAWPPRIARM